MRLLCLLISLLPSIGISQNFIEFHEKGWFWYEKQSEQKPKKPEENLNKQTDIFPATRSMELLQKQVAENLNRAILYPTEKNLLRYVNDYYHVINQAQNFSDSYKMMLLKYPEYDYYLRFPVNHHARLIHERHNNRTNQEAVKKLAMTYGFLFFYSSDCQYCHAFAPTMKRFAERYGVHVMAISIDGGYLPEFPDALPNNGIAKTLGVKSWPSLFAVNPITRQVIPLSNGVVSVTELEETVFRYAELAQPNEHFPQAIP